MGRSIRFKWNHGCKAALNHRKGLCKASLLTVTGCTKIIHKRITIGTRTTSKMAGEIPADQTFAETKHKMKAESWEYKWEIAESKKVSSYL